MCLKHITVEASITRQRIKSIGGLISQQRELYHDSVHNYVSFYTEFNIEGQKRLMCDSERMAIEMTNEILASIVQVL